MSHKKIEKILVTTKSLINILGVVYAHTKVINEGDLYFTEHGLIYSDILEIENWYEKKWFETHQKLELPNEAPRNNYFEATGHLSSVSRNHSS